MGGGYTPARRPPSREFPGRRSRLCPGRGLASVARPPLNPRGADPTRRTSPSARGGGYSPPATLGHTTGVALGAWLRAAGESIPSLGGAMRRLVVILVALATMSLGAALAGPAAADGGSSVLPPNSKPHGQSYAQWSAAWWQWALAIPSSTNPLFEQNGKNPVNVDCSAHQTGKVWYLVGVISVSG